MADLASLPLHLVRLVKPFFCVANIFGWGYWLRVTIVMVHSRLTPLYKPPIMDISTAAYDDVELILERIEEELRLVRHSNWNFLSGGPSCLGNGWPK